MYQTARKVAPLTLKHYVGSAVVNKLKKININQMIMLMSDLCRLMTTFCEALIIQMCHKN